MTSAEERRRNLALFAEELHDQLDNLNTALLQLESDPSSPGSRDSLMRAAHTVKGAARMVGLTPIERFAHALEELLVAGLAGEAAAAGSAPPTAARLDPPVVELLLTCFDRLAALGQGNPQELPGRLEQQAGALESLGAQLTAQVRELAGAAGAITDAAQAPATSSEAGAAMADATAPERVVKVDAQQLNRITALAGEAMVAVRWLQPYADALQQLRSRQRELAELIARWQPAPGGDSQLALIREKESQCQQLLLRQLEELEAYARRSNTIAHRLYGEVLNANMRPFHEGLVGLPRLVRDLAASLGKRVQLEIVGRSTLVDRDILRRLEAPINHGVRNAIDHGLEPPETRRAAGKPEQGLLRLEALHRGGMLSIAIRDDGAGVDLEAVRQRGLERGLIEPGNEHELSEADLLDLLLRPGFSTARQLSEVSGRGVGLDVVQTMAREVGGSLRLSTVAGGGTSLHFQLPLTLSVVRTLLVRIGREPYAVPLARLDQIVAVPLSSIHRHEGKASLQLDGQAIGLIGSQALLGLPLPARLRDPLPVMVLSDQGRSYGLVVEEVLGEQDLVVRPLDPRLGEVPGLASAALLGDGAPILVLDVGDLLRLMQEGLASDTLPPLPHAPSAPAVGPDGTDGASGVLVQAGTTAPPVATTAAPPGGDAASRQPRAVLVVDDSRMVRESLGRTLEGRGYRVAKAADGQEALERLQTEDFELVVSDVEMPRVDGFALVRRLRAMDQPLASLPVLILSSRDQQADRIEGLEAGADRYLAKGGFHEDTLLEAVQDLIGPP
ncbi:MAG: response regulator [Cyanobium sp.]